MKDVDLNFLQLNGNARLSHFMSDRVDLVEFWLKHMVSASAMDDLLLLFDAPFRTWKSVTNALHRTEDVPISSHAMWAEGHKSLGVSSNGTVQKSDYPNCTQVVAKYSYIGIWERLPVRIQNPVFGPQLFDYHRK